MADLSDAELERRFADHRIPRRHLYPWWYLLYRALGMPLRPPVYFSLAQHFYVEGLSIAVILVVGSVVNWWLFDSRLFVLAPLTCLVVVIPLLNWRMYRKIRARIGL